MVHLFATDSQAAAHSLLLLSDEAWEDNQLNDEGRLAGSAVHGALERYISGDWLFIHPRTKNELESILRRYAYDGIHNAISRARSNLKNGGYSRMLSLADQSIGDMLGAGGNADILLKIHSLVKDCHAASYTGQDTQAVFDGTA